MSPFRGENVEHCPRCSGRIFEVETEFGFAIPQCIMCGFENYFKTRSTRRSTGWQVRLNAHGPDRTEDIGAA